MNRFRRLTSRKDCIVLVLLKKQTIMNESKRFVCELLFFENMTIISFFARSNLSFLHDLMRFQRRFTVAMNAKTNCLRKYADNVFCVLSRNVRCDLRNAIQICSLQRLFEMIHSRDHAWSSHRQFFFFFFWSSSLIFDKWRMLILDYRVTYACSRSVERRMFVLDLSSDVWDETSLNLTRHFIKFVVSDSLNLTKATHQTWWKKRHLIKWRKRLIKLDESDVISSSQISASSHQTFWKDRQFLYFLISNLLQWHLMWRT
jgi:hypothetical protein